MSDHINSANHPVMTNIPLPLFEKLKAIAKHEKRHPGPQASQFIETGIDSYLKKNPALAKAINETKHNNA